MALGRAPLWGDELFSVYWSQLDWHFLLGQGARLETNPPGYYLLLHVWLPRFGTNAAAARTLSVLCSGAAIPLVYALGRTLLDRPTALLAGLFAAVEPTSVLFAQEARPYAMEGLLDAVALVALAVCARAPSWRFLALFVAAATGALFFHYTAMLFIAACYLAIAAWLLTTRPFPRGAALAWAGAALVTALAAAWPVRLALSLSHSANIDWIGPLSPRMVAGFFVGLLPIPGHTVASFLCLAALCAVFAVFAVSRWRMDRAQFGVLLLVPTLFCLIVIGASVWQAILLPRVGAWLVLPLCLLLARAAMVQPNVLRRLAVAGVTLAVLLSALGVYFRGSRSEDWPGVAWLIATEPSCAGPVLVSGDNALGLAYYGARLNGRPLYLFLLADQDRTTAEFWMTQRLMHLPLLAPDAVAPYARAHKGTMVLMRRVYLDEAPAPLATALRQAPFRTELSGGLMISCF